MQGGFVVAMLPLSTKIAAGTTASTMPSLDAESPLCSVNTDMPCCYVFTIQKPMAFYSDFLLGEGASFHS